MWKRSDLKRQARKTMKRQYWMMVAVCFLMALLTGVHSDTLGVLFGYDSALEVHDPNIIFNSDHNATNSEIVNELLTGIGAEEQRQEAHRYGSEGILAPVFNGVTQSGSFVFGILNAVNQVVFHDRIMASVVILVGALLVALYYFFISSMLVVSECRYFMEAAHYPATSPRRLLYLVRIGKIWNVDKVMFFRVLYTCLWDLTIVGGFVKRYSYKMVPYILAENPAIGRKEAFALSRRMMRGNKWKAFLLDCSFLGWWLLNLLTFGLLRIFYMNPYQTATTAQLYFVLRERAIAEQYPYYECLNDTCLAHPPRAEGEEETVREYLPEYFPIPERPQRQWIRVDYRRNYSFRSIVLLFFTFAIFGWIWEVVLNLAYGHGLTNRGVLHGPWLPIYGFGGVLILVVLKRFRDRPLVTFSLTVVLCGILEYMTSWILELMKGVRWWDYSGYFFNLNGRICLEGLVAFGIGGCAFVYLLAPTMDNLYRKIPGKIQNAACVALLSIFLLDVGFSYFHPNTGKGITDYEVPEKPKATALIQLQEGIGEEWDI